MSNDNCPELQDVITNLTEDERLNLSMQPSVSEFRRNKLDKDAKKNWDLFYKRNGDRFFKNRYWTRHEFNELFSNDLDNHHHHRLILEVGCGCGDFVLPLLECDDSETSCDTFFSNKNMFIYCCDFSNEAIDVLKSKSLYKQHSPHKIKAFVADITHQDVSQLENNLDHRLMDIVSMIFVLSAVDPNKMKLALSNIARVLKPGGLILFRDYAIYDKAMLRFSRDSKISDKFYVRQDGTRAYFFSKEKLIELFEGLDFSCQTIEYIRRETINNATKHKFSRIFLQAKFRKN